MRKESYSILYILRLISLVVLLLLGNSCSKNGEELFLDDFIQFWEETKFELDIIPIEGEVIAAKIFDQKTISLVRIKSLGGVYFYAWVAEPIEEGTYKAKIQFSGFGRGNTDINLFPNDSFMMAENTISMKVDIRGQGLSTEQIGFENYLSNGNQSKETYIYRGAYMDAVRAVDYIVNKPNSNGQVLTYGGSQGGLLSIVATALNKEIDICVANFPFLADVSIYNKEGWAMSEIMKGIDYQEALDLLQYFDATNFSEMIEVPYFSHCGEEDAITPLEGVQLVYDNINTDEKELYIAPCQGHGCSSLDEIAIQKQEAFIDLYFDDN